LTKARRSSVFNFAFFFFFAGLGRGEEGGYDDNWLASSASSWFLFFDMPVFELFAADAFILQGTGVFTHIHSGATELGRLWRWAQVDPIYARDDNDSRGAKGVPSLRSNMWEYHRWE
jgi:hypothetical protein